MGIDSLSHSEVVKMSTEFIAKEPTMQDILTTKYPMLLTDESQDTKKELVDVLLTICEKYKGQFTVGMFGDTMQKIYNDGKDNLADCIPHDWAKPVKKMNYRSAVRIVELANSIRKTVDNQEQKPRSDAEEGFVRLFIVNADANKDATEKKIASMMSEDTNDTGWDDAQARGFLFSYEKLFGAKAKTPTDIKNEREGKDTSIMRTARLFYVACTRAQKSLAVVAYTENVNSVKETALSNGWFSEGEIYTL